MADDTPFVQKIKSRQAVFGSWLQIPHPIVAETMAQSGMDFLLVDGEHAPIPTSALIDILPGVDRHGTAVVYRVPWNRPEYIKAALDAGVKGIMVPMVNSAEEAAAAASTAKYPPDGTRGAGAWRASNYYQDDAAYRAKANESTVVIVQIETKEAVDAVDAIAATSGVDVVFIGPGDLALSLGIEPGVPHPKLRAACEAVVAAAKKNGIVAGIALTSLDTIPEFARMGFGFFTYGIDILYLLNNGRQTARDVRAKFGSAVPAT
ncbi:HpcH/HpaI aldolase family protein [Mesorhizobium sp. CO1-1-8]|uniref:HpcH/HpaI aldolase family protein n=1 Tax=Mesorhizobium sp. CO1-1-8 TaxID=2876631 RepID=UPI001CD09116|nr:aldolase/citrate lyase family protein [Mesorhizobium sp. CO1-1-8]MBZ9772250.1 4-hydroxy-2-oxovalerate aldolase [Mesorhizobium sp. CO1-1-8]